MIIGALDTNLSEILIEIHTFWLKKIHFKMPSGKWRPFYIDPNALNYVIDEKWRNALNLWSIVIS